ncbi:hypothetical protein V8C35DRAFT_310342 [Trichoderma chlorosporum]
MHLLRCHNSYDMSRSGFESVQPCGDPNCDTSPTAGQPDNSSLNKDDIAQRSVAAHTLATTFIEKTYASVTTESLLQDTLSDDFCGLEHVAFAVPCSSQRNLVGAEGNNPQENLPHESFTASSQLPIASWDPGAPSAGLDSDRSYHNAMNSPKIGTRFSRESSKLLTQWFSNHYTYPYPSKQDIKALQHQTGLSKTQVNNWLANTRRREKMHQSIQPSRKAAVAIEPNTASMNIPTRPDTPTVRPRHNYGAMGPLERWVDSPPESEPATVTAIVNAVQCAESSQTWPMSELPDDGSGQSVNESSDNSFKTSSGSSLASIYSYGSGDSIPGGPLLMRSTSRRRRRKPFSRPKRSLVSNKQHPFQCTFCAETFRTKYDWQRHEKTLHMPLERWLCSPDGPRAINPETGRLACVFCDELEPTDGHINNHNAYSCRERVFNRKDHLKQHLHLVHKSKLVDVATKGWKTSPPTIRSRCGFCGTSLDSWGDRAEHLADHFKMGKTMANWTGDWGFEDAITDTLENAIPPYLLGEEMNSPFPFEASDISPESPRTAYELLAVELSCFVEIHQYKTAQLPSYDAMQIEACRIIFASEVLSFEVDTEPSWLRDLIMSNELLASQAQFLPLRTPSEGRLRTLEIRGKKTLFQECLLEAQLHTFVLTEGMINPSNISNETLRDEGCKILTKMQQSLSLPLSDFVFTWFMELLQSSSTNWLSHFRGRAKLPFAQTFNTSAAPILTSHQSPWATSTTVFSAPYIDSNGFDSLTTFNEESNHEIAQPVIASLSESYITGLEQKPADLETDMFSSQQTCIPAMTSSMRGDLVSHWPLEISNTADSSGPEMNIKVFSMRQVDIYSRQQPDSHQIGAYMFHDPNFYKWLGRELTRWVNSIMSPNNPNCHVPSDEEIQHHARYLVYNDDDPWNQTVADNLEWLRYFKVSVGIITE